MLKRHDTHTIDAFLGRLGRRIQTEVLATPAARPAMPIILAGGKRLRSRLLWHCAQASIGRLPGTIVADLERAAAAIELAHLGSLVHDDIVDDAATRRNATALHRARGLDTAVRAGTALLHLASALVASLPRPLRGAFASAVTRTCRGQVRELLGLRQPCTPLARLSIVREKTSAFFELAAHCGAQLAGAPLAVQLSLQNFARDLGAAFQIGDDIADLVGSPSILGRANGADIRDGVMTLPVILAQRTPQVRRALRALWIEPRRSHLQECLRLIVKHGAVQEAAREGRALVIRALRSLELLPPGPSRIALETMALEHLATHPATLSGSEVVPVDASHCDRLAGFRSLGSATKRETLPLLGVDVTLDRRLHDLHPTLSLAALSGLPPDQVCSRQDSCDFLQLAARAAALRNQETHPHRLEARPALSITLADCLDIVSFEACTRLSNAEHASFEHGILESLTVRESSPHYAEPHTLTMRRETPAAALR